MALSVVCLSLLIWGVGYFSTIPANDSEVKQSADQVSFAEGEMFSEGLMAQALNSVSPLVATSSVPTASTTTSSCLVLKNTFRRGARSTTTDGEVFKLQVFLRSQGLFSASTTGFFGPITEAALKEFQLKNRLISSTTENIVFGPKSRQTIEEITCGRVATTSPAVQRTASSTATMPRPSTTVATTSPLLLKSFNGGATVSYKKGFSYPLWWSAPRAGALSVDLRSETTGKLTRVANLTSTEGGNAVYLKIPANTPVGKYRVRITLNGTAVTSKSSFNVVNPPVVASVTPTPSATAVPRTQPSTQPRVNSTPSQGPRGTTVPTPTPTQTVAPTQTPTPTTTVRPTVTSTPSPTPTTTSSPRPTTTSTPKPSPTTSATPSTSPTPTTSSSPSPSASPSQSPTIFYYTPSPTSSPTPSTSPTPTPSGSPYYYN